MTYAPLPLLQYRVSFTVVRPFLRDGILDVVVYLQEESIRTYTRLLVLNVPQDFSPDAVDNIGEHFI